MSGVDDLQSEVEVMDLTKSGADVEMDDAGEELMHADIDALKEMKFTSTSQLEKYIWEDTLQPSEIKRCMAEWDDHQVEWAYEPENPEDEKEIVLTVLPHLTSSCPVETAVHIIQYLHGGQLRLDVDSASEGDVTWDLFLATNGADFKSNFRTIVRDMQSKQIIPSGSTPAANDMWSYFATKLDQFSFTYAMLKGCHCPGGNHQLGAVKRACAVDQSDLPAHCVSNIIESKLDHSTLGAKAQAFFSLHDNVEACPGGKCEGKWNRVIVLDRLPPSLMVISAGEGDWDLERETSELNFTYLTPSGLKRSSYNKVKALMAKEPGHLKAVLLPRGLDKKCIVKDALMGRDFKCTVTPEERDAMGLELGGAVLNYM